MTERTVIYTAIFGGYDELVPPRCSLEEYDLVCFTDDPGLSCTPWNVRVVDKGDNTNAYMNRYYKMLPHRHFGGYDRSVYIDGNITILHDPALLIENALSTQKIALPRHSKRDCIYDELSACVSNNFISADDVKRYLALYKAAKIPHHCGLFENNLIIRAHNDPAVIHLMDSWWEEFSQHEGRDQLSLVYYAKVQGVNIHPIVGPRISRRYFMITAHGHCKKKGVYEYMKHQVFANQDLNILFRIMTKIIYAYDRNKTRVKKWLRQFIRI